MSAQLLTTGTTSHIAEVLLRSSSTGNGLAGLAHGDVTCYYMREGAAANAAVELAAGVIGEFSSGGWVAVDATNQPGLYQVGIPNAALVAGALAVTLTFRATGAIDAKLRIILLDPQDTRFGLAETHLLKAALANASVHDLGTGVDQVMDDDGITPLMTRHFAAEIEVDGADWEESTNRLTLVGAFTRYVPFDGDVITLTAGTGVVAGDYVIVAKVDDNTLELEATINDDGGDIDDASIVGRIANNRIYSTVDNA